MVLVWFGVNLYGVVWLNRVWYDKGVYKVYCVRHWVGVVWFGKGRIGVGVDV